MNLLVNIYLEIQITWAWGGNNLIEIAILLFLMVCRNDKLIEINCPRGTHPCLVRLNILYSVSIF